MEKKTLYSNHMGDNPDDSFYKEYKIDVSHSIPLFTLLIKDDGEIFIYLNESNNDTQEKISLEQFNKIIIAGTQQLKDQRKQWLGTQAKFPFLKK